MSGCPRESLLARFDDTRGAERMAALDHVRVCGRCREVFHQEDPSRVFALLALRAIGSDLLEEVSSGVARETRRRGSAAAAARARTGRSAAWAAAILLAVALGSFLFRPAMGPPPSELARIADGERALPAAGVELLSSPGAARVVDLTVGETQVVMIFDEGLDL